MAIESDSAARFRPEADIHAVSDRKRNGPYFARPQKKRMLLYKHVVPGHYRCWLAEGRSEIRPSKVRMICT